MWRFLAELIASEECADAVRNLALATARKEAAFIGSEAPAFFAIVKRAPLRARAEALTPFVRHRGVPATLARIAASKTADLEVRGLALRGLADAEESPPLLALASRLRETRALAPAARAVISAFEAKRSSTIEAISNAAPGDVLRDRGAPVKIDQILDLGSIEFGASSLEFWDPVQVLWERLRLKLPLRRVEVFAALSGDWTRCLKLKLSKRKISQWRRLGQASGKFGVLVLSRTGVRTKIERASSDFVTSFWDDIFDEVFDPSDGAAIIDLDLGGSSVPILAWNDNQQGGTLFAGLDDRGDIVEVIFDGVRITQSS